MARDPSLMTAHFSSFWLTVYLEVVMRHYGFFNFLFDVFMTCVTAGLWLIWVFVREMRHQ